MAAETTNATPAIKAPWIFGLLDAFLVFLIIASYSSRMANDAGTYDEERRHERLDMLAKQRAADEQTLTTADWIDASKGTVRIPIDESIPETVMTLKTKPVQMGAAIPGTHPFTPTAAPPTPGALPGAAPNETPAGSMNAAPGTNAPTLPGPTGTPTT